MKLLKVFIAIQLFLAVSSYSITLSQTASRSTLESLAQSTSSGWLDGWTYRKAHNITGSTAGAQANYQISMLVHYDSGLDFDGEVYLDGKCRPDFGDVRFTDPTGNELDYWIQQKADGVSAVFWVEVMQIPESPNCATIFTYYGNPIATTTSNVGWVFPLHSDFEDATKQGWTISWNTFVNWDDVSTLAYQGNYSRGAGRSYGTAYAGNGNFYESFRKSFYLSTGTYYIGGATKFAAQDSYKIPKDVKITVGGVTVCTLVDPGDQWHWLTGNLTIVQGNPVEIDITFHLYVQNLYNGGYSYYVDSILVRKYCNPEPAHGSWGPEVVSDDKTPPTIGTVSYLPTCPYPFVPSLVPRQGEPIAIRANVTEETGGSGINYVRLIYRADGSAWQNTTLCFNVTLGLWVATMPGQKGNATVEFYVVASDNAGNLAASSMDSFRVKPLITGDINGDGAVTILDVVLCTINYGKTQP